ncbi:hypothetical protein GGI25_005021 [Coemansia spiralis]|uniref:Uncharacterized protein n=1 Tax=Coemansia spiralis TaxID=417178 RepID=A0A9W8G4Z1_9FUNG|nr:hypothetical protein GGI26_005205 [Coemansia sp. RSA 1358]KAJ2672650.1 hypothetical protein GGI25_005021 [Coemansia spiralis]
MPGEMAIPPDPGLGTDPAPPSKTWSAVVAEGNLKVQNLDANSAARKRINISSGAQPIKKFSTYAILNGGACNMGDKPAKLVSVHPGSYYVGFDIPKTCTENELYKALDSLDVPLSVHLDKKRQRHSLNPLRKIP